jgi:beta-lactamase class A
VLDDSGARELGADRWRLWRRLATAARAALSGLAERVTPALEWAPGTSGRAVGADRGILELEATFARIARRAGGRVGVAALHLETGREAALGGAARFPMASVVKVPVAVQLLALVDQGEVQLESMLAVEPHHVCPGIGVIASHLRVPGVALSVRNLLGLALVESDNTAADVLFHLAGGEQAVTARMHTLGICDISVDRRIVRLLADTAGLADLPADDPLTPSRWAELRAAIPPERRRAAARAFLADPRDTATPGAIARLLAAIWRGTALSPERTALLLDLMARCATGTQRLAGLLPPGTRVAHKTGSLKVGVNNDAGIIYLPDGAGHVAMAVFIVGSPRRNGDQDRAAAQMARAAYEYFVAHPS